MNTVFAKSFTRDYQRLPQRLQRQVDKVLGFLLSDFRHRSLRVKKMGGLIKVSSQDKKLRQIYASDAFSGGLTEIYH